MDGGLVIAGGAELPVLAKIRKLLNLAKSANEHEAALAASRAAELMAEHGLAEAELRVTDATKTAEPIDTDHAVSATRGDKRATAWKWALARGVTIAHGVKYWRDGGGLRMLGRKSNVQAADYTITWLAREVERLADDAWEAEGQWGHESARTWKNAFKLGCADRIAARLTEQAARHPELMIIRTHERGKRPAAPEAAPGTALAVLAKDAVEVCQAFDQRTRGFVSGRSIGQHSSRSGHAAGHAAGGRVNLGGGPALGSGSKRLGGGS